MRAATSFCARGSLRITSDILAYDVALNAGTPPSRQVADESELGLG